MAFLWALNKEVICKLSSFQAITMSSKAFCSEYCTDRVGLAQAGPNDSVEFACLFVHELAKRL